MEATNSNIAVAMYTHREMVCALARITEEERWAGEVEGRVDPCTGLYMYRRAQAIILKVNPGHRIAGMTREGMIELWSIWMDQQQGWPRQVAIALLNAIIPMRQAPLPKRGSDVDRMMDRWARRAYRNYGIDMSVVFNGDASYQRVLDEINMQSEGL